uniref:Uncharacterized protein n=1 Tax=Myotis myotis TaxID=51298 RepID=A0A7J7V3S5_MYOMY|nr:hypothetical protein mMyoMyo1_008451 [Myotis myotis]
MHRGVRAKQQAGGKAGRNPGPCALVTRLRQESMVTKHSLLSLWSGLEGVKGTHRMTGSLSQLSFRKGQGQGEVRAPWVGGGLECQAPRVASSGRGGVREGQAPGWVRELPTRQRMWPGLRHRDSHKALSPGGHQSL